MSRHDRTKRSGSGSGGGGGWRRGPGNPRAHLDHLGTPRALTNQAGELVWSTYQRPYGEVGEKTKADPLSGRVVVTDLRLPGQWDERVLTSLGLQGPYYNWNRWYLPSVGRYLELDPLALAGEFNTQYSVDWYNYVEGNPLSYVDSLGLDRYDACKNPKLGRIAKWLCRKSVDWRCNKNPGEQAVCCEADAADCRTAANGDTDELGKCEMKKAQCELKVPKKPDEPKKPLCN